MNIKYKPFFSVVIPVYNKQPHINRSIQSVLNQTFSNFEVLLIDDASNDGSLDEIRKFTDTRVRILYRDRPGPGGYAARNLGITHSRGTWVAFLDADDRWHDDHLENMYKLSQKFPDIFFMASGSRVVDDGSVNEHPYWTLNKDKGPHTLSLTQYLELCLDGKRPVRTGVACVKRSSPVAVDLFPTDLQIKRGGDLYAWLKIMCYHKEMAWSNHIGVDYYKNIPGQVVKTAPTNISMMGHEVYENLSKNLDRKEKILLAKYLNHRLFVVWKTSPEKQFSSLFIIKNLYWKNDPLFSLLMSLMMMVPRKWIFSGWRALKYRVFKL